MYAHTKLLFLTATLQAAAYVKAGCAHTLCSVLMTCCAATRASTLAAALAATRHACRTVACPSAAQSVVPMFAVLGGCAV